MRFEDFIGRIHDKGLRTINAKRILYLYVKATDEKVLLMRWGKTMDGDTELLCYIDFRFNKDGTYLDTYAVPLKQVTTEMLDNFIEFFKNSKLGRH